MNTTSDTPNSCHPQWGAYAPSPKSRLLRLLITLGLGRSTIRKKILITWRKKYGHIVDVEVRGIKYRLNISDNVTDGKILVSSKIYDKVEIEYLSASSRENNFIDIGANIGYYSLAIAHKGAKRVLAIEPNPPTLKRLNFNIRANRFDEKISVIPVGIGQEGEFELFHNFDLGGASLIKLQDTASAVTITTKPLWDILQANNITTIGGLKIDIEGREDLALGDFLIPHPKRHGLNVWL
ncbi:MAG: FkbM family methyltransferase [Candidatus Zeuxoniibacter abyssi]|nr:MAG: FkbM family methyltransferase [Candidatus Persebacteraceae bacterium AB1(2)]